MAEGRTDHAPGSEHDLVTRAPTPPQPSLFEGIRQVSRDADQRLLVVMLGARFVMIGAIDVLLVLLAIEVLDIGGSGAGYLTAAAGLGGVLGGALTIILVGRGRLSPWLALGAIVFGLGLVAVSAAPSAAAAAAMMVVCGISLALVDVAGRTLLQRIVPDEVLAGVFGLVEGFAMAGLAIGSILPAILVTRIGLEATFAVTAAILPIVAVFAWFRLGRAERRIRVPTQEIRLLRSLPLFAPVPAPALEAAARALEPVLHTAGTDVIRQGDVGDRYYVIERGRLRVSQGDQRAARARAGRCLRGDRPDARGAAHGDGHGADRRRAAGTRPGRLPAGHHGHVRGQGDGRPHRGGLPGGGHGRPACVIRARRPSTLGGRGR